MLENECHRNKSQIPYWHGNHTHILFSEGDSLGECESKDSSADENLSWFQKMKGISSLDSHHSKVPIKNVAMQT